jgi:hypothetical protein
MYMFTSLKRLISQLGPFEKPLILVVFEQKLLFLLILFIKTR